MKNNMNINKETAMRLWTKQFGKSTKAIDFAGREIAKSAYDDRKSSYGWNIDHILPQSKGGVTADHNLICCSILTNDEKADRIVFKANGKLFRVMKFENHYEIVEDGLESPNFFDSAYGIRRFDELDEALENSSDEEDEEEDGFSGEIVVYLKDATTDALIAFIKEILDEGEAAWITGDGFDVLSVRIPDIPLKKDTQNLLDQCVLLNTYLSCYFVPLGYLSGYSIYFRMIQGFDEHEGKEWYRSGTCSTNDTIYINDLVIENTSAKKEIQKPTANPSFIWVNPRGTDRKDGEDYYQYDYTFTKLGENLGKEVISQKD